jgi:uncharacterized protein YukE
MTLILTPAQAEAKINQIDNEMVDVRRLAERILDSTQTMCASSWQGGRAQTFSKIMAQHHEDFTTVLNNLQQIVDKGKSDIRAFVAHETA